MIALFFTWLYACHLTATLLRLVCLRYSILVSFSVIFLVVPDEGPEWTESASTLFSPIKIFIKMNWFLLFALKKFYLNTFKSLPTGSIY